MKTEDIGLKVTAIEALAFLVPGVLFLWGVVQLDRTGAQVLAQPWPETGLDTFAALAAGIVAGVVLQEIGHVFKWPYDKIYAPFARRRGDPALGAAEARAKARADFTGNAYDYAKTALRAAGRPIAHVEMAEGISKMFRAVATAALAFVIWFAAAREVVPALMSLAAMVAAFVVHARFRLDASTALYQTFVQWCENHEPKNGM